MKDFTHCPYCGEGLLEFINNETGESDKRCIGCEMTGSKIKENCINELLSDDEEQGKAEQC